MTKTLYADGKELQYNLQYKKVKNINLRIKSDGSVYVSASGRIPQNVIDEFVLSKADFIFNAVEKFNRRKETEKQQYFEENDIRTVILDICKKVYPYFEKKGVKFPEIKFRKMVSRWGSCHSVKGILTFNTNLMYAPLECIEYVVLHEFTHFLQANHSYKFYHELAQICPDWKKHRKILKEINIR